MSKYEKNYSYGKSEIALEDMLAEGESIIWKGKPKKSAFIINKSLIMMPIALIWLVIDIGFILVISRIGAFGRMGLFLIPFFALHLLPVWIWLSQLLTAGKKWANTQYAFTDRRIIVHTGFIGMQYSTIYYKEIVDVQLRVGVFDKMLKVGDIFFRTNMGKAEAFLDIEDAYEIYPKLQKTVLDIQTDMHYPNDLRPAENSGYKTQYKG